MANETLNIQNGVSPITIDTEVTEGSMRPVTSDGIYKAIQAGGGGGGSSSVLDVVCTATSNLGNFSYSYSHTGQEAVEAITSGKIVRLWIKYNDELYATCPASFVSYWNYMIADPRTLSLQDALSTQYLLSDVGAWSEVPPSENRSQVLLPTMNEPLICSVPMYIGTSDTADYVQIKDFSEFNGSLGQLVLASIGNAGTAIGATITDPDLLPVLTQFASHLGNVLIANRPAVISDTYFGTTIDFDVVGFSFTSGKIRNITGKTVLIENGDLEDVTVGVSFVYSDGNLSQVQLAAYCDSHTITFM